MSTATTESGTAHRIRRLRESVASVILGKPEAVDGLLTTLLAGGHPLIEDVPGVGKTAMAMALARSLSASFRRIQFTPDLLPSDITGVSVYDPSTREFVFKPGPIFASIVLADEINRATPRTQSALLEAMNEGSVTVDGITHPLPSPFMVVATQNPIEFTGTFPLPESQMDRFFMTLTIGYPSRDAERGILAQRRDGDPLDRVEPVLKAEEVDALRAAVRAVRVDPAVSDYLLEIVGRTRDHRDLAAGASPRASLHLSRASQAHALLQGREFVTPDDVKVTTIPVLAHRVMDKHGAAGRDGRWRASKILAGILAEVPVPQ